MPPLILSDKAHITQGDLPHWDDKKAIYFATFRLADSLPITAMKELELGRRISWNRSTTATWPLPLGKNLNEKDKTLSKSFLTKVMVRVFFNAPTLDKW